MQKQSDKFARRPISWVKARPHALIVVVVTALGGLVRSQPRFSDDPAVFVSVFEAVASGDRLYVDIFDHKDPVFFWLGAIEYRLFGIYGPFIAEVLLLVIFAVALMRIGTLRSLPSWAAGAIAVCATGLLARPAIYDGVSTSVLGMTVVAVGAVLVMEDKPLAAGVVFATALFAKLPFAPLVLPFVIAGAIKYGRRSLGRGVGAGAATASLWLLVLAIRGEFWGYVDSVSLNLSYAWFLQARGPQYEGTGLSGRARIFADSVGASTSLTIALVFAVVGAGVIVYMQCRNGRRAMADDPFALVGVGALVATFVVLATTFIWPAHLQILPLSLALVAIELTRVASTPGVGRFRPVLILGVFAFGFAMLWPTVDDLSDIGSIGERWSIEEPDVVAIVEEKLSELQPNGRIEFAAVNGHLQTLLPFLDDGRFHLACPDFFQHNWFGDRIADNVKCVRERADFVVRLDRPQQQRLQSGLRSLGVLVDQDFDLRLRTELTNGMRLSIYEAKE